jgi:hypothetical protein
MNKDLLQSVILEVLEQHRGRGNPIRSPELEQTFFHQTGMKVDGSQIRAAMNALRKDGVLIGSASGSSPKGYYMIETWNEYDQFIQRELGARLVDLSQTISAMNKSAERKLLTLQPELF